MIWVKLKLGPVSSVEEGGVDTSLKHERSPAWLKCHAKFVFMLTCDMKVTYGPAMTILKPLCFGTQMVVAFAEVIMCE